jgi:hypothetical protein
MRDLAGYTERLQVLAIVGAWRGVRNIGNRLRRLSDRDVRDHSVGCGVDDRERIGIFEPYIDARAVARGLHAVRKIPGRSAYRQEEVHVVGDRTDIDGLDQVERRLRVDHLRLADIL